MFLLDFVHKDNSFTGVAEDNLRFVIEDRLNLFIA